MINFSFLELKRCCFLLRKYLIEFSHLSTANPNNTKQPKLNTIIRLMPFFNANERANVSQQNTQKMIVQVRSNHPLFLQSSLG